MGISTLSFTGLNLGNPVSGMYEAKEDCSVSWTLQDDSGNVQHFAGVLTSDARRAQFHQTDPVGTSTGILVKSAETCVDRDFRARYRFTISGNRIDVDTAEVGGSVSSRGVMENDGSQLVLTPTGAAAPGAGSFQVDDDCFVRLDLMVPTETGLVEMNFRGILADDGAELLGLATDPGTALSLRLTAP